MATTATAATFVQQSSQRKCLRAWWQQRRRRFTTIITCCALVLFLCMPQGSLGAGTGRSRSRHHPPPGGGRGTGGSGNSNKDIADKLTKKRDSRIPTYWHILRKHCRGCWSGSVDRYLVAKRSNELDYLGGGLNFRLCVETTATKGRWTVWNLEKEGDERISALSKDGPASTGTGGGTNILRLAFPCGGTMGLILRIPQNYEKVPRLVLEVGFWDTQMRRSCVMIYKKVMNNLLFGFWKRRNVLRESIVIQQRRRTSWGFVGNTTNEKDIPILPTQVPCSMSELLLRKRPWKALTQESLDLSTLERKRVASSSAVDQSNAREVLNLLLSSDYDSQRFCLVLPCGIAVSVPRTFGTGPCVFAHVKDRRVYALWLEYDERTTNASRSVLYTYE